MKPFIRYYGGKWRAAPHYPRPENGTIVEPFAGAAGYSMRYPYHQVILIEPYFALAEMWRWLIAAKREEVERIPLVDDVEDLPLWVPNGARVLIGFAMNAATATPRKRLSAGCRRLRENGRKLYGWTSPLRERVAQQVMMIKHWKIIEGDYTMAPDVEATWFIDPPYSVMGNHYVHGSDCIDYQKLAAWSMNRQGQRIVCEQDGATWLPFRQLGTFKAGPSKRVSAEVIWP